MLDSIDTGLFSITEAILFPFLNRKLDFNGELEQHKVIHAALAELLPLFRSAKEDPFLFDATKIDMIMRHLREPLVSSFKGIS